MKFDREWFEKLTLHDCFNIIDIWHPNEKQKLPQRDRTIAATLFKITVDKFNLCTEREKRQITRSDAEFVKGIKWIIIRKMGFNDEIDAFGIDNNDIPEVGPIPRIPRGNELFWIVDGDLLPKLTHNEEQLSKMIEHVYKITIGVYQRLYPELYEKMIGNKPDLQVIINTSHFPEIMKKLESVYKGDDNNIPKTMKALSNIIIDGVIMEQLVSKDCYINTHKRNQIRNHILDAIAKEIESKL